MCAFKSCQRAVNKFVLHAGVIREWLLDSSVVHSCCFMFMVCFGCTPSEGKLVLEFFVET